VCLYNIGVWNKSGLYIYLVDNLAAAVDGNKLSLIFGTTFIKS